MESPLPCRVQDEQVEHVVDDDDENKYVFEDRSMMVRTPPPSYHYAVSTGRKNDDPWLARVCVMFFILFQRPYYLTMLNDKLQ